MLILYFDCILSGIDNVASRSDAVFVKYLEGDQLRVPANARDPFAIIAFRANYSCYSSSMAIVVKWVTVAIHKVVPLNFKVIVHKISMVIVYACVHNCDSDAGQSLCTSHASGASISLSFSLLRFHWLSKSGSLEILDVVRTKFGSVYSTSPLALY